MVSAKYLDMGIKSVIVKKREKQKKSEIFFGSFKLYV